MSAYASFRWLYRVLDKYVMSRFTPQRQHAIKRPLLNLARNLFPQRIIESDPRKLVSDQPAPLLWRPPALPEWVRDEMAFIAAEIDPSLDPKGVYASQLEFNSLPVHHDAPGKALARLRNAVAELPDIVLLVPWLKRGGADLGAIYFARALHQDLGRKVLVIGSEASDSPWASRLPAGVQFLEAGPELAPLAESERIAVITRLLVQLKPEIVHVMNSPVAWQSVLKHGLALRQQSRIFVSLYCDDRSASGYQVGYAQSYLADCYTQLAGILTDNTRNLREWCGQIGVPQSQFHVVGFPARQPERPVIAAQGRPNRLLWAGRFDRQKRPDLIAALAKALPEFEFDVYGEAVLPGHGVDMADLKKLSNVHLHGAFEDLFALIRPEHLALVYTSEWDGLPTILLDCNAAGLLAIAPDVGGISDLVPDELLVRSVEDIDAYAQKLRRLAAEPEWRERLRGEALQRIAEERSWAAFVERVREVPGYLSAAPAAAD